MDRLQRLRSWQDEGARVTTIADRPGHFIDQHVSSLFYRHTTDRSQVPDCQDIESEEQFWGDEGVVTLGDVRLRGFKLTDWFPRAPGVYWSRRARRARNKVYSEGSRMDMELGQYYSPEGKMGLIEEGGVGTIRLRPRKVDGEYCWLGTALTGTACHAGIPLAIPDGLIRDGGLEWGDRVSLRGRVRFLQDAGLEDAARRVHHARPLIVFVDELQGISTKRTSSRTLITPVALFESTEIGARRAEYTFVHCVAGSDHELDGAVDWITTYASKYKGRVITNFDEQRPVLADAPLSYQRLVARTYDRTVIEHFHGSINVDQIDRLAVESSNIGDIHVGHKVNVGGSAIINIDSVLTNVTQTIGAAPGLEPAQKKEFDALVHSLRADLDKLKASHPDETKEIVDALQKTVTNAAKPPEKRKNSLLQLSAKGLKDAAALFKDIAPTVLATAEQIAKLITDLKPSGVLSWCNP